MRVAYTFLPLSFSWDFFYWFICVSLGHRIASFCSSFPFRFPSVYPATLPSVYPATLPTKNADRAAFYSSL